MLNNTIHIGNSPAAPFLAFGDESIAGDGDTVVYAYVVVHRRRIHQVEARLRRLKSRFKIPQGVMLHCRQLMAPHQREKLGISHLTTEHARNVIGHAVTLMNESAVWVKYAYCSLEEVAATMGKEIVLRNQDGSESIAQPVNVSSKAVVGMLAHMSMVAVAKGNPGPRAEDCQIFASEERTPVQPLFGSGPMRRADSTFTGFSDVGAPAGYAFQVMSTVAPAQEMACFQLADIAAYMCANALAKNRRYPFYADQVARLRLWTASRFMPWGPDGRSIQRP